MRLVVAYQDAAIHSAACPMALPPPGHIRVDSSDTLPADKLLACLGALREDASINTGILTHPGYQIAPYEEELQFLEVMSAGRGITIMIANPTRSRIQHELEKAFTQRIDRTRSRHPGYARECSISAAAIVLSPRIAALREQIENSGAGEVVTSYLTYMPNYNPREDGHGILNIHVDRQPHRPFHVRLVETETGNSTIGFADSDFEIVNRGGDDYRKPVIAMKHRAESGKLNGWAGGAGSIFAMRAPCDYTFERQSLPGIHASGLIDDGSHRRWTITHDVRFLGI